MTNYIFWGRVKSLIRKNKTTQTEAATACHVSPRTFQNWIRRGLYPTIIDGYFLANFLGVSVDYLVTGREKTTKKQIEAACCELLRAYTKLNKIRG